MLEIFTWILISDILVLIIVFVVGRRSCYFEADSPRLEELLLRGGFSLVELLFRDRFSVFWRIIEVPTCWRRITEAPAYWWRITKAPAYCWRIIEASTCWLEDYRASCLFGSLCRYFCLLQKHDLIDSSIGTAVDLVAGYLG